MQLRHFKTTLVLLIAFVSINCSTNTIMDSNQIYALIVNHSVVPLPPPRPPFPLSIKSNSIKNKTPKKVLDSIKNIQLNVAVNSAFKYAFGSIPQLKRHEDYNALVTLLFEQKEYNIQAHLITNTNSHNMVVVDKSKTNRNTIFKDYNALIYLSEITFNRNRNKAVVIMGVSYGKLSGETNLYLLEKKEGKWLIISLKKLSES